MQQSIYVRTVSRLIAGLIALALVIAGACEAGHAPVRQTGESAGTASVGASVAVARSARNSELPVANAARTECGAIAELLRSAAMTVGDGSSTITPPRDTTDRLGNTPEEACVVAWHDSTAQDSRCTMCMRAWSDLDGIVATDWSTRVVQGARPWRSVEAAPSA